MFNMSNANMSAQPVSQGRRGPLSLAQSPPPSPPQQPQPHLLQAQRSPQGAQQTPRMPGQKSQKLRMSCDVCAAAKVRCSKQRPRCERCVESDFTCVYGLSLKHGKSAHRRRNTQPSPSTKNMRSTTLPSEEQTYHNILQWSVSDLLRNIDNRTNVSSTLPWLATDDVPMQGTTLPSALSMTTPSPPAFDNPPWTDAMAMDQPGSIGTETMNPTDHFSTNIRLESIDDPISFMSNDDYAQFLNTELPTPMDSTHGRSYSSVLHRNTSFLQSLLSRDITGIHDCYMIAHSTLALLHFRNGPPLRASGSDDIPTHSSGSTAATPIQAGHNLDDMLHCTRDAMGNLLHLLECPCAIDPHMTLLNASLIMRILYWHQLVAGVKTSPSTPIPVSDLMPFQGAPISNGKTASNQSSCSASSAFGVGEPVKIGNYIPDQEDQEPMRQLLLLINLKKLGKLIDAFSRVKEPADLEPSHYHITLSSWLNSELSQAIKEVVNGANVEESQQV